MTKSIIFAGRSLIILTCFFSFNLITYTLFACDMFMLQTINNYPFFTLPSNSGDFNDPNDFFEAFKSQANQTSGNRDGYGIVAYEEDNPFVDRDFMWYKTGMGNYFDENDLNEPFYEAISVLYGNRDIDRVLVHTRSGTGGQGSHPFIFNTDSSSYTFMHNGYIFNSIKEKIITFLGEEWFQEHPSQWEGDFNTPSSFIDSEILFHYLMFYILQYPDDIPTAIRHAFNNKQVSGIDMEFILKFNSSSIVNFIFSDGVNTYAYRSSKLAGNSYNLSYEVYPNHFVAIRTGTNLANTLEQNQMIKITPQGDIIDLSLEPILRTNFSKKFVETVDTNQYNLKWKIQSNNQISSFNIYRALNQNFATARPISSIPVNNSNQTQYQFSDYYESEQTHYYWIEVVFNDNGSEITSNIPSSQNDDEPDISEVNSNISLYPNPFQNQLNILVDSDQKYSVKIFNLKGQMVNQFTYNSATDSNILWDSSIDKKDKLANGIYIIKFISANGIITKKVMRIK